jgi:ABC-2 type transport system ATP-binding protein
MESIKAENIVKQYAGHTALDHVNINVPEKSIFGLLGPNGAGKTSLIRIINQITGPDKGDISFFGEKLQQHHIAQIGYLPEERGLYKKMKVSQQALYLARLKGMSKYEARKELYKWFERLEMEEWWNKRVEELSKGMAQKVQFVTTVLHQPKLLILDEPFSGFDPINAAVIKEEILRLRDEGTTVILSTHNMASVEEICDHIALLNRSKKILDGSIKEIKTQYRAQTYEIDFTGNLIAFTNALWAGFELLEKEGQANGRNTVTVKLLNDNDLNSLLNAVLPHVKVEAVREVIPTMNDIFIKVVKEEEQEEVDG